MPIFDQQPNDKLWLPRVLQGQEPEYTRIPTAWETVKLAAQTNWIVSVGQKLWEEEYPAVKGHDPMDMIRGTIFHQEYQNSFIGSTSPRQTQAIMDNISEGLATARSLDAAGFGGLVAQVTASSVDPTLALPGGFIYKTAKGVYTVGRAAEIAEKIGTPAAARMVAPGFQTARSAGSFAALGGAQASIAEAGLEYGEETHTLGHAATGIASAAILSGLLGTGVVATLARSQRRQYAAAIEKVRIDMDLHAKTNTPAQAAARYAELAAELRARAVDDTTGTLADGGPGVPGAGAGLRVGVAGAGGVPGAAPGTASPGTAAPGQAVPGTAAAPGTPPLIEPGAPATPGVAAAQAVPGAPAAAAVAEAVPTPPGAVAATAAPEPMTVARYVDDAIARQANTPEHTAFFTKNIAAIVAEAERRTASAIAAIGEETPLPLAPIGRGTGLAAAGGAAATDVRELELVGALGVEKIPLGPLGAPTRDVMQSSSTVARRLMADNAEMPYLFWDNFRNIVTSPVAAIDRLIKMEVYGQRALLSDELTKQYATYYFDNPEKRFPVASAQWQRLTGNDDGKMSYHQFKKEVSYAVMAGGKHENPQVVAAANYAHALAEKWPKRAEKVASMNFKMLVPEDGEWHFPHMWSKTKINGDIPGFVDDLTKEYKKNQELKRMAQQRLKYVNAQLQSWTKQINKLQARIQRIDVSGRDDLVRLNERAMEVRRLDKRAGTLEERVALLGQDITEREEFITAMREGLTDPDLLVRLDEMEAELRELRKLEKPMTEAQLRALEEQELGGILIGTTRMAAEILTGRRKPPRKLPDDTDLSRISPDDLDMQEADALARSLERVFADAGILDDIKTIGDVGRVLRDERVGNVTLEDLDRIAAGIEAAEGPIPARVRIEEQAGRVGEVRSGMEQVRTLIRDAIADRGRKATQARATEIRAGEARLGERANLGRLGVLDERLTQKANRRELMLDYLQIAQRHHDELRAKIEEELGAFEGNSALEAKSALKAREKADELRTPEQKAKQPRLTGADDTIDKAVKNIVENRDYELDDETLTAQAMQTMDRILGTPDGRLPYDVQTGGPQIGWKPDSPRDTAPRGSLAHRALDVSNAFAKRWIEDDIELVMGVQLRTMVPDVLIAERHGDVLMTMQLKEVQDDYHRMILEAKGNPVRARELRKEMDMVIGRLADVRDRMRGVFGWSERMKNMARVATSAKMINNITTGGMMAINSIGDMAGAVFLYGFKNVLQDGWQPYLSQIGRGTPAGKDFVQQMRALGIGVETLLNMRQHSLDDIIDVGRPQSTFERGLQTANDKFFIANMLSPMTDMLKVMVAHVAVNDILRASKAVAKGTATKRQLAQLHAANIDQEMAVRIAGEKHTVVDGVTLPNTADWADPSLAERFNAALGRAVDTAVLTPGEEKSLFFSTTIGSILGQFKGFTQSATEKILIANLQRRDANSLQGLVFSVMLGMLAYKLNSMITGRPTSDRPQDWFKEGVSRAGVLGWLEEGNAIAAKATGGTIDMYRAIGADKPLSKFAARSAADMLLGPTWNKIEGIRRVTGSAFSAARGDSEWSQFDTTATRRLVAAQNLPYTYGLFSAAERGINGAFGIPMRILPPGKVGALQGSGARGILRPWLYPLPSPRCPTVNGA